MTALPSVQKKVYANLGNPAVLGLVPESAKTILDLGCGAGDNARILKSRGKSVVGVTYSPDEALSATEFCEHVYVGDLEAGVPIVSGEFDAVICSHVLEHICFPEKCLKDVHRLMSPGGTLVVALPNLMNYRYRFRLIMGRFEYEANGIMDNTHFRWYTFTSAEQMLNDNSFEIVTAFAEGSLPLWPVRRIAPKHWLRPLDKAACRIFPGLFGGQLVYSAKRILSTDDEPATTRP